MASIVVAIGAADVAGQDRVRGVVECAFGDSGRVTVRGRLYSGIGKVSLTRFVSLRRVGTEEACSLGASDGGVFEFRNVPAGQYGLGVADLALAEMGPVRVDVPEEGDVWVTVPLYPKNRLLACLSIPACARVLTRPTPGETNGSDQEKLRLLGYRLGVVLAAEDWKQSADWVACVDDYEEVGHDLRAAFPNVADPLECELRETRIEGLHDPIQAYHHIPSGRRARVIRVHVDEIGAEEARIGIGYTVGRLWGQGNLCTAVKIDGQWVPQTCTMTMIS